jgi:hypothetical protein
MTSTVRIAWDMNFDNTARWNDVSAWAIKYFGLPGDRYHTRLGKIYMEFIFKSNKDALLMALMWNAPIVPDNDLTVEYVGNLINA